MGVVMRGNPGEAQGRRRMGGPGLCRGPGGGGPGGGRYRRSILETSILALLAQSTAHGYDLIEQIQGLAGDLICIDAGTVYRLLRAMEEQGCVTSSWEMPQAGPSRRVYTVTPKGLDVLEAGARALAEKAAALQRLSDHADAAAAEARERGGAAREEA